MKLKGLFVVFLVLALTTLAGAQTVGIGTSNPGSIYHSAGSAIAKVANEKAGIKATIQPYASPTVYIPATNAGELQFGLGNIFEVTLAYEGKEFYEGRPTKELRLVAIIFPLRNGLFVRKDSKYKTVADLKGQRMPDGYTAQKTIPPLVDAAYGTAGLTRADFKGVQVPNVSASVDAFIAGKIEGFFFAMGSAKVREADAAVGIRAIPFNTGPEAQKALDRHFPGSYFRVEKAGPDNPGVYEPCNSIAYDALIFASAKTPDDMVYKLTKAMFENKADMVATFAPMNLFEQKDMAKKTRIPYHNGAIKFYQEKGLWPPKH
ncbi:MAG: TAXI family TRAP transporter solute-binding subunit [Syntrophorhabdaceae bacterium]|nr:TAXI family TRAP transporter solute-binding subunit [Syntrophorhabdaceae bacterium]